jgi:hypothetical protein
MRRRRWVAAIRARAAAARCSESRFCAAVGGDEDRARRGLLMFYKSPEQRQQFPAINDRAGPEQARAVVTTKAPESGAQMVGDTGIEPVTPAV